MTEFKVGDKVCLKAKPEIEGEIIGCDPPTGMFKFEPVDADIDGWNWILRYPEEIELVPEPIKVGDTVTWGGMAFDGIVLAIDDYAVWVRYTTGASTGIRVEVPLHLLVRR